MDQDLVEAMCECDICRGVPFKVKFQHYKDELRCFVFRELDGGIQYLGVTGTVEDLAIIHPCPDGSLLTFHKLGGVK